MEQEDKEHNFEDIKGLDRQEEEGIPNDSMKCSK